MLETSKSIPRRLADCRFATRYFVGEGIDIGAGKDGLGAYAELFPGMKSCRIWDLPDGDAQKMGGVPDATYDFVHSSHCLEHLVDPVDGLGHWVRILKPGGHLVVMIPDEDLYEQGQFPSNKNRDHKWTFTIHKPGSWSPRSVNVFDLIAGLGSPVQVLKVELLDATYRYRLPPMDQTQTYVGECGIEFILRKPTPGELEARGYRLPKAPQKTRPGKAKPRKVQLTQSGVIRRQTRRRKPE